MTSEGPIILGLTSLKDLKLITLHCAIQKTKCVPVKSATCALAALTNCTQINSATYLIEGYPEQVDRIDHFVGEHYIVLQPYIHLIIHAPRKCPIHIREKIKVELEEMMSEGIICKVNEPTNWVSSIVYVRKNNDKLQLCKDQNKVMEELTNKLPSAKFFSKLDAKNGYWSVKLDQEL